MGTSARIREAFAKGGGVLRLAPTFVPRRPLAAADEGMSRVSPSDRRAARVGVAIVNASAWEPMVMLRHFGPDNPETPGSGA